MYSSRTGYLPEAPKCIRPRVNNSQSVLGIEWANQVYDSGLNTIHKDLGKIDTPEKNIIYSIHPKGKVNDFTVFGSIAVESCRYFYA